MAELPRVLVVDDEASICSALKRALDEAGYDVVTTVSGADGEALFKTQWFDLMILDFRLRDRRGDELYYHAIGVQPHLARRTVFLTGDITDAAERLIRATGCPLVMKPYNISVLENLMHYLLSDSREASA